MATGAGLGGMMAALLPLVGLVTILQARRSRRKHGGTEPVDEGFEKRRAATQESERRMAAYLAQRGAASYHVTDEDEQEIRR